MLFVRCSGVGSGIGGSPPLTIDGVVVVVVVIIVGIGGTGVYGTGDDDSEPFDDSGGEFGCARAALRSCSSSIRC